MNFLVTGGAGFIGSAVIRFLASETKHKVLNLDKLTYAGNLETLAEIENSPRYQFIQGDICDRQLIEKLFAEHQPDVVMHLAAESHVDRSIDGPSDFIQTNIVGTAVMLECARDYYSSLTSERKSQFRFHHISTDEVFGSLGETGLFTEESNYDPSSPYSASKASSDHLVRAWHRTYGLPVLITNCSNNYGPYQFPEKLIPLMILNAIEEKSLPIYGDGQQIRDWLYVEDHARALYEVVQKGKIGETYNIGGNNEKTNLEVVETICDLLDELHPSKSTKIESYKELITSVTDRPGHDRRYAIDAGKVFHELNWKPEESFETGLRKTVSWFLGNPKWCKVTTNSGYQRERLGKGTK
tara:strand:+ start:2609 stop:3673 length:1065 start_codon:yes stop_codon:yes gene_type:complete